MDGVLDKKYAHERLTKKYLEFRYKERALVASWAIKKYLNKSDNIKLLDFGASEGLTLIEIARLLGNGEYVGVEYDRGLIDSAPPLPQNIKLIRGDVNNLQNIESGSMEVITALALLEHLEEPLSAFQEVERILETGGIFVATSPVPFWDKLANKFVVKNKFGGEEGHKTDMNKKMFLKLTNESGLQVVDLFNFMWVPVAFLPYLKISITSSFAWRVDKFLNKLKIFNWSFVNQCLVAKKIKND